MAYNFIIKFINYVKQKSKINYIYLNNYQYITKKK
jgi:hypothetical protein